MDATLDRTPLTRSDVRLASLLFAVTFVAYAYTFGGGGWNQNATLALVRSIVEEQSLSIDHYRAMTGDVSTAGGRTYSNKPPGAAFLCVPVYAALVLAERSMGMDIDSFKTATVNAYLCVLAVCALPGALIPAMLFLYGRSRGIDSQRWLAAVCLAVAFGTPLFGYSTVLFIHVPSAALALGAFVALVALGAPLAAGLLAGLSMSVNYLCAIPAAVVFALALLRAGGNSRLRSALRFAAGGALPLLGLAAYQWAAFGSFLHTPISHLDPQFVTPGASLGVFTMPHAGALWGITLSPYRGLFHSSPLLLLAVPGAVAMYRRGRRAELAAAGVIAGAFVLVNASFNGWWGGNAISARYLLPIVPFVALPLLYAGALVRKLFIPAALVSVVLQTLIAAVDVHAPADLRDPLRQWTIPQFVKGRVPVETDDYRANGARAGYVAVNPLPATTCACTSAWSSFNLGEAVFPQGSRSSILPLAVWMAGASFFALRSARGLAR